MPPAREISRVSLHTLGCKLNYAETSSIAKSFTGEDSAVVPFGEPSDVFILNTCSVTENAERECRQIVRRVLRNSPNTFIIATGCYAQLRPEEIASIEGVDLVLGASEKHNIRTYITGYRKSDGPKIFVSEIDEAREFHFAETAEGDRRTRAFLKVQDGCDYSCSFCTIPTARGSSRSAPVEDVLRRARNLSSEGFREIVLTGVNVGDFGHKIGTDFFELIKALESDPEITVRIRISSIEPNLLSDEIIHLVALSQKFCPHFHIPLQSGSATVLRRMRRRYQPDLYRARIERIKKVMPNAAIGADVIAGFPGESDAEFRESMEFITSLDLSYLHAFTYSERPGTVAATMKEQVPVHIRRERTRLLRLLSAKKRESFYASQIGTEADILLESSGEGYSQNYIRTRLFHPFGKNVELVRARITGISGDISIAEPIQILGERKEEGLLPIL